MIGPRWMNAAGAVSEMESAGSSPPPLLRPERVLRFSESCRRARRGRTCSPRGTRAREKRGSRPISGNACPVDRPASIDNDRSHVSFEESVMKLAIALSILAPSAAAGMQDLAVRDSAPTAPASRTLFTGRVVMPDGLPARGALVVSSAGGRSITGADGGFELDAEVPPAAACVDLTATLDGARSGSL